MNRASSVEHGDDEDPERSHRQAENSVTWVHSRMNTAGSSSTLDFGTVSFKQLFDRIRKTTKFLSRTITS